MNDAREGPARAPLRADLILVAVTAAWGVTFVVVKDALDAADPFTFLAIRFAVAGLAAGMLLFAVLVLAAQLSR